MIVESKDIVQKPLISVVVITYNQERYIRQCIEAILAQRTDFPYELIISDDCSRDNTPDICKAYQSQYPDKIRLLLQEENRGVARNYRDATAMARGKFIASMAGDDYWVLDTKLKLQKEYLDAHPKCILCYTNVNTCDEQNHIIEREYMNGISRPQTFINHLETKGYIAPLTWMYRKELLNEYTLEAAQTDESFALALDAFMHGEVHYIDVVTAHYRLTTNSLSRQVNPRREYQQWIGVFHTQCYYLDKYTDRLDRDIVRKIKSNEYIRILPWAYSLGYMDFVKEAKVYFESIGINVEPYIFTCRQKESAEAARQSKAYRLGNVLLSPVRWFNELFGKR